MDAPSKRQVLVWLLAFALFSGFLTGLFPQDSSLEYLWSLISLVGSTVLLMRWFVLDARLHDYRISGPMFLCLVALMAPTAIFYFFATRRFGFWKSLLKSTAFFLMFALVSGIGAAITQSIMTAIRR
ncbi:hypothetical protein IAD21_04236 [Abditibacteriota bacterium]|nr:hypothetical protein IAD21_04236 [Abditibacteriota bacterium]